MRAFVAAALLVVVVMFGQVSVGAWGLDVHRSITARALDGLPDELRPFFAERRDFIIEHSVDPDLWRVVGLRGALGPEDPNHFLDIDVLDEPVPFTNVPRDRDAFIARYGLERAEKAGRVPWRVAELYEMLVNALRRAGASPYGGDNARYLAAVIAHYVEDAFVPFHAVANYDGQLTGQTGIHSRFESALVLRNEARLSLAPVSVRPVPDVRSFIFETIVESAALVPGVLEADRHARAGTPAYDDAYFETFLERAKPTLERRLAEAASGVASVLVAAWHDAGRPALGVSPSP